LLGSLFALCCLLLKLRDRRTGGDYSFHDHATILPEVLGPVGDKVRREKALDFSGCKSRPGTGSLHPVAIEAAAEATKLSELSM
jgi:hypothetical protein